MVWDVDLIVFFHQTTQKEKVLSLLLAINREDNVHSTTSLQVQHGSVAPPPPIATPNENFLVWFWHRFFFFFFFFLSQKLRGRVTRNIEKKAHGLTHTRARARTHVNRHSQMPDLDVRVDCALRAFAVVGWPVESWKPEIVQARGGQWHRTHKSQALPCRDRHMIHDVQWLLQTPCWKHSFSDTHLDPVQWYQ